MAVLVLAGLQGQSVLGAERVPVQGSSASTSTSPSGASDSSVAPESSSASIEVSEDGRYEEGVVLVRLCDGVTAADLNTRLAELDYIATKSVSDDDVVSGYVALDLAAGVSVAEAERRIVEEDVVAGAQPNYIYHLLGDALGPTSSGASRSIVSAVVSQAVAINDARANQQWALDAVHAREAWENVTVDKAVTVAVVDNGCLTTHEDLKNNIVAQYDAVMKRPFVDATNGGHGTHVCGVVAAEANNALGVAGVSYNAGLLPISVFIGKSASTKYLLDAYSYIEKNAGKLNIRVVNMSLGAPVEGVSAGEINLGDEDWALVEAVDDAYRAGILTVCASGNAVGTTFEGTTYDGAYLNYPSDWLGNAIGVIATQKDGSRAGFSNYNMAGQRTKKLSAPGVGICSTYSTSRRSYLEDSGTSMASPYVAGVAALVFAVNPGLTPGEVTDILCRTAQDLNESANLTSRSTFDLETGFGLVDAKAATVEAQGGKVSLRSAEVTLSGGPFVYSGSACRPTVTVALDGETLVEGADYALEYSDNVNAGTATVTVKGAGDYIGMVTKRFEIEQRRVTPTVSLSPSRFVFDGSAKTPVVTVNGGDEVIDPVNFTVEWLGGRTSVGRYSARVVARSDGNYAFESEPVATFEIVPKGTKISKLKAGKKRFTAKWKKQTVQTSGYQLQYCLKKSFASKTKTITIGKSKKVEKTVKKLKGKRRYYVRVRTFKTVGGVRFCSDWSAAKSVKTR